MDEKKQKRYSCFHPDYGHHQENDEVTFDLETGKKGFNALMLILLCFPAIIK